MNKEAYYYGQQIKEYKDLLKDKKKAKAKATVLLKKLPAYNEFLQKHSQLAGLFNLSSSATTTQSMESLQTRAQVNFINGGFEQNYLSAFFRVAQLKNSNSWQGSALLGISKNIRSAKS